MAEAMPAEQARALYELLDQSGVRCWVMGGWGVDALLGRVTRAHKDLDLLVLAADVPRYADVVRRQGFTRKLEWDENRPVTIDGHLFDSAFVDAHSDGREIDVHVIEIGRQGEIKQFHNDPWPLLPDAVNGSGSIDGAIVRCVTRSAQVAMHSSYDLPEKHRDDMCQLLRVT